MCFCHDIKRQLDYTQKRNYTIYKYLKRDSYSRWLVSRLVTVPDEPFSLLVLIGLRQEQERVGWKANVRDKRARANFIVKAWTPNEIVLSGET